MILTNKSFNISNSENINNHAKNYKRNYKLCQKLLEKKTEEVNITFKNETTPLLIENKENLLRDEVLNWFFSLPLETRFKIITVENSWVINILHQMHVYYKQDQSIVFEIKKDKPSEKTENDNTNTSIYFLNQTSSNENPLEKETLESNFLNHFNVKTTKKDKYQSYLISMFLKETRFFSVHSNIDCVSLSPKVLDDKDLFSHYFKTFSKDKWFTNILEVVQDAKTKYLSFEYPKWIEKDFHQMSSFIISFFEQSITIKFILNLGNKIKDKITSSLMNEGGFNDFFKLRKEIIYFLYENYPNNKNLNEKFKNINPGHEKNEIVDLFVKNINIKKIYKNIFLDSKIMDFIKQKNHPLEKNYTEFFNRKLNSQDPLFEGVNEEDTEKKITKLYANEEIIIFVDSLIFSRLDSIWRLDFYFGIYIFEAIHNLYTEKNADDLLKEFETESNHKTKNKYKKNKHSENDLRDIEKINFNYYKPYLNKIISPKVNSSIILPSESTGNMINNNITNLKKKDNRNLKNNFVNTEVNMICSNMVHIIIDEAIKFGKANMLNRIKSLDDVLDNLFTINKKSKEINNILVNMPKNNIIKNKNNLRDNLSIECAYDIELGLKDFNKNNNNKNNFRIENHQISIENTKVSSSNYIIQNETSENTNIIENIIPYQDAIKYTSADEDKKNNINNKLEDKKIYEDKKLKKENSIENLEYVNLKNIESEYSIKTDKNSCSDTETYNNETEENLLSNNNQNQPDLPDNQQEENYKEKVINKKKIKRPKIQKFYQINIEKLNKKKNPPTEQIYSKGNSHTINKSTQTSKELKNLNVNLKINNNYSGISSNNNLNEKKNEKKTGKNSFNSTNNQNLITNPSSKSNTINSNKITSREFSKYDYPKNHKKNSFNRNQNNSESSPNFIDNDFNKSQNKDINFKYNYSFNKNNINNYNLTFNYDMNFDHKNNYPYNNIRKKSNNWNDSKMSNNNYFDDKRPGNNNIISDFHKNYNSNSNSYSITKPNTNNNEFLAYVFKLHYDIIHYHNDVIEIVKSLKDIKNNVINYIENILKECLDFNLSLDVFGSFASDLSIESSDIDLKVNIFNPENIFIDYEEIIFNLVKKINNLNIFEFVMPIHTASVPIIKLVN